MTQNEMGYRRYPEALVNITNRCTLRCNHCFIYRDGYPNAPSKEMDTATMIRNLSELQGRL